MNIKSISSPISSIEPKTRSERAADVKAQHSTDRDADGRRQDHPADDTPDRPMTEEEVDTALALVRQIPGIVQSGLSVKKEHDQHLHVVLIMDPTGQVVRRLTERDLWSLLKDQDSERATGHLVNKAV